MLKLKRVAASVEFATDAKVIGAQNGIKAIQ
jgi:hypothetical protein